MDKCLEEIESHEQDILCLSDKMQDILKNSDDIYNAYKTSPAFTIYQKYDMEQYS